MKRRITKRLTKKTVANHVPDDEEDNEATDEQKDANHMPGERQPHAQLFDPDIAVDGHFMFLKVRSSKKIHERDSCGYLEFIGTTPDGCATATQPTRPIQRGIRIYVQEGLVFIGKWTEGLTAANLKERWGEYAKRVEVMAYNTEFIELHRQKKVNVLCVEHVAVMVQWSTASIMLCQTYPCNETRASASSGNSLVGGRKPLKSNSWERMDGLGFVHLI